jgi:hypothetical protein
MTDTSTPQHLNKLTIFLIEVIEICLFLEIEAEVDEYLRVFFMRVKEN